MNWINDQVSIIGSAMQVVLGYAAITGIVVAIVAAWVWIIGRVQFCLRETFWIVSWLAWKGWIWRKHRMSAKEYLKIAIAADERDAYRREGERLAEQLVDSILHSDEQHAAAMKRKGESQ